MTDRDTFAAAALTGILARGGWASSECAAEAYLHADAMLAFRDSQFAKETNYDAAPAAKATADKAAPQPCEGTGDISEAQIDALQHVVEDRRFDLVDYGHLRSLLVRLRPEWEDESDKQNPISNERLAALEQLSALDQKLELEYGLTGNPLIKAQQHR